MAPASTPPHVVVETGNAVGIESAHIGRDEDFGADRCILFR